MFSHFVAFSHLSLNAKQKTTHQNIAIKFFAMCFGRTFCKPTFVTFTYTTITILIFQKLSQSYCTMLQNWYETNFKPEAIAWKNERTFYSCKQSPTKQLTMAHSEPSVVAIIVAARGQLYIKASSPKDPAPA